MASSTSPLDLKQAIQRLRQCSQRDIQSTWRWYQEDCPEEIVFQTDTPHSWLAAPLNDRQHIAWPRGEEVFWLYQSVTVPDTLHGYPLEGLTLRIALAWWAEEAQVFVDGQLVQVGDLFDFFTRICLSPSVAIGDTFNIAIRLISPGHDDGALVRSHLVYEVPMEMTLPSPEPSFVADELEVLVQYAKSLAPEKLGEIEGVLGCIDWGCLLNPLPITHYPNRLAFHQSLANLRKHLLPLGDWLKQRQIYCLGHAHLDLAWLWPVADTWRAAMRTFESVLNLHKDFPELTYSHSSPALFAWLEQHHPDLFSVIQQKVREGSWAIDAGLWVEPELNIVSGESIARQMLYGQRYCQEKFGTISKIAWLPDTFGFCNQLPQLLKLGGVDVFATQKLRWNDTTQFPHELFNWQALDGSEVLGWTLPPIGTDFDPVQIAKYAAEWEANTGLTQALWLPGIGDHGGGPTRDMLEKARRWAESPFFPQVDFSSAEGFLEAIGVELGNGQGTGDKGRLRQPSPKGYRAKGERNKTEELGKSVEADLMLVQAFPLRLLPKWADELYLELHRGCYTTHADQKQSNRRCEDLLYQAELFSTIAQLVAGAPYPKVDLETAWKKLLFNQFHDILPGSSIPEVFEDANRDWAVVKQIGKRVLDQALGAISTQIQLPKPPHPEAKPLIVFNALSWERSEVVTYLIPEAAPGCLYRHWKLYDFEGQAVPMQTRFTVRSEQAFCEVAFWADVVPSVGYRGYWLYPDETQTEETEESVSQLEAPRQDYVLANQCLQVTVDAATGDMTSLFDKTQQREALSAPANQLQVFRDQGQYWDAWNIAPDYENHPLPPAQLKSITWFDRGPLRQRLRVIRQLGNSEVTQDYTLEAHSPVLKIETWVDWFETQVVLKVNFPLTVEADQAAYETPFGAIARPTRPQTDPEKAKWEVPALRWADLSQGAPGDDGLGVSILTDCKHGFDVKPHQLRLTLLKAPLWPDPDADRGSHHFNYAVYPHAGGWQRTPHRARELNMPMTVMVLDALPKASSALEQPRHSPHVPAAQSFLQVAPSNLILTAFKPAEDHPEELIVRAYDATGQGGEIAVTNALGLEVATPTNLLEQPLNYSPSKPYKIHTYRLKAYKPMP
ncbi:MAG: alpha-mannosidase [Cyanobacteria bacterium P01_G01_bin.38]